MIQKDFVYKKEGRKGLANTIKGGIKVNKSFFNSTAGPFTFNEITKPEGQFNSEPLITIMHIC